MAKSTISMAIFNSYFDITRGYMVYAKENHRGTVAMEHGDIMEQMDLSMHLEHGTMDYLYESMEHGDINKQCGY